jgi:hypothetical protein
MVRIFFTGILVVVGAMRRVGKGRAYERVTDTNQCSETPGGPIDGPCERGREFCGPAFGPDTPRFHIMDLTCGENDPNCAFFGRNTRAMRPVSPHSPATRPNSPAPPQSSPLRPVA